MARRFPFWNPGQFIAAGRRWALALLAILAVLLGGCFSEKDLIERMTPAEDNALARKFIEAVRTGQIDAAREMLDPKLNTAEAAKSLAEIRRFVLNHGEPRSIDLVGYSGRKNFAGTDGESKLAYQIHFADAWVLARMQVLRKEGPGRIGGAHFTPQSESLEAQNAFTFRGKSPAQYGVLVACAAVPLVILLALVVCIRSRVHPKWVWIIFSLFGFCRFDMNWTTGAFDFSPFTIQLLGVGFLRSSANAPWIFSCSIPLGALVFLLVRRWLDSTEPPPLPGAPPSLRGPAAGPPTT